MGAMVEVPQAGQVAKKMIEYGIEGLGMSRDRWKGMGSVTRQSGEAVYVRDDEEQQRGERVDVMADINNISCKV